MQATPFSVVFSKIPQTNPAKSGIRELQIDELFQVGGGLPKGGWQAREIDMPANLTTSLEPLPKGGWAQA